MDKHFKTRLSLWFLLLKEHRFFSTFPLFHLIKLIFFVSSFLKIRLVEGTRNGKYLGLKQTSWELGDVDHLLHKRCNGLKKSDIEHYFTLKSGKPFAVRTDGSHGRLVICSISNKSDLNPYFFSKRTLCFETKSAWHDLLVFYPEYRGQGDAKKILNLAVDFYGLFGITKIYLTAGLSGGAYWIKAGFAPLKKEYPSLCKKIKNNIKHLPPDLVEAYEATTGLKLVDVVEDLKTNMDPDDLYQLRMFTIEGKRELGERLFANTRWEGVLDLSLASQRRRLDIHLGKAFNVV